MMDSVDPPRDLDGELTRAQIAKTNLEVAELERPKWDPVKYVPFITTLVAVIGLLINSCQTHQARLEETEQNQRNLVVAAKSQSLAEAQRLQNQIRADKLELLQFISDDTFSTARVMFLLDDLTSLLDQLSNREDLFGTGSNPGPERQQIADLLQTIAWQVRFDQERHIDFDVQALHRWPAYKDFWIANGPSHHLLLSKKYYTAISNEYSKDTDCIEGLDFHELRGIFVTTSASKQCETGLFPVLTVGFKQHLEMMKKAGKEDFVRNELDQFALLTNHGKVARWLEKQVLGSSGGAHSQ